MSQKRPPVPVIVILVILVLAVIGYFIWDGQNQAANGTLTASGTVESTTTIISPELAGKVSEVMVDEGDPVAKGASLFTLDGSVLKAQQNQAQAALDVAKQSVISANAVLASAKVQYQIAEDSALQQETKLRTTDWKEDKPNEFEQPGWFFTRSEQLGQAQIQVDAAKALIQLKTDALKKTESTASSTNFMAIEKELLDARKAFQISKDVLDVANGATSYAELKDAAETNYDNAKDRLYDAQDAYDEALTSDAADDILTARAELRVALETYDTARDYFRSLQTGMDSLQLSASKAAMDQAQSGVDQAAVAEKQAQVNLDLLNTQVALLTISAPADGVIFSRTVEPGEVVTAGYNALTLADLNEITITVYVPEDRIGEVKVGEKAALTVDTFPGETFQAQVTYISDQAEFTPRNVQTVEGRKNTVFAVKLSVQNVDGKLKPGMPADVKFE
jgi:HlyD family secretion protein